MNSSAHNRKRSVLMLTALVSLLLFGCRVGVSAGSGGGVGTKPQFRLKTLDGRKLGPRDFPGKVVVVDFWATWCGPCHIQARILDALHKDYEGKDVQFLAANVGEDEGTVKSFIKGKPVPYPVLLDEDSAVSDGLGVLALPTVMVVDKTGKITYLKAGLADAPTLKRVLKEAGM